MKTSALRIPAAFAACFAVVLAGAPGASATPSAPVPGVSAGPTAASDATAGAVAGTAPLEPADDEFTAPTAGTALVDVLANDGLEEPAAVRLLLVDPSTSEDGDALGDELRTDLGSLRVVSPETDPASLPEDWEPGEHPVLLLTPVPDLPSDAPSVQVAYAVVDSTGAEARAVLTVTPDPGGPTSPSTPTDPTTPAEPTTSAEPELSAEPAVPAGPTSEPADARSAAPGAGEQRAAAAAEDADVPDAVRQALEAAAARESARTGEPTGGMRPWTGGWEWPHENGPVLWSPAHGAHYVHTAGAVGQRWSTAGGRDGLGYPVNDEVCGMVGGGCRQTFSGGGSIFWSPATGAKLVRLKGAIGQKWGQQRWERGALGYPVNDEVCGMVGGGCRQTFSGGGSIYWSPATGAKLVRLKGAIGQKWGQQRWERGALGYPTGDLVPQGGDSAHQKFQHGIITWTRSGGARTHPLRGECQNLNNGRSVQPTRNAARVSLTIAEAYGRSEATFVNCVRIAGSYVEEWRTSAHVGASGFKRPGVPSGHTQYLFSPQGSYSVTESFGVYNPGTALPYRQLNPDSRWGGRPGTLYNKYFESRGYTWPDENMWYFAQSGDYRLGVVINYNRPPDSSIVQGNGFAIFLHANKKPTAGCIALHEHEVARYMRTARPGDRIIMGVRADLFR